MVVLTQAGYVSDQDSRYFLAGGAQVFWGEYRKTHKTVYDAMKAVKDFLGVSQIESSDLPDEEME